MAVVSLAGSLWSKRHSIAQCQDLNEAKCYKGSVIYPNKPHLFLISNFCRVGNVMFFLLCHSPASEFYVRMFWNTICSMRIGHVHKKNNWGEIARLVLVILLVHMAYDNETDSVPKRLHIQFRCWGITQKKEYDKPHLNRYLL